MKGKGLDKGQRVDYELAQGGLALAVQADVSKPDDIARLFAETKRVYGELDVLVNNAGILDTSLWNQSRRNISISSSI